MNPETGHPSSLELDRAVLGLDSPGLREHLACCELCRAHVERARLASPIPTWVRELRAPPPPRPWWAPRPRLLVPAFAAAAALVTLVLVLPSTPVPTQEPYVGVKGAPVVTVYIKHGEQVAPWDGRSPILPGDRLRLHVSSAGYGHVLVGTRAEDSRWVALYAAPLEREDMLLPTSWRVDASGGEREELLIIFSQTAVAEEELDELEARDSQDDSLWTTRLVLPKEAVP
ncbi:hypothetical protein [Archangium lansingense]|uniref:Anti-sigma-K factor rskA n=1 Tax=Archangium lansingense TaxID=2995310 RepID=A0ABT4AEC2_9BACT|nr:hypothetical protein [Archangium lansinium]MCY1079267.1 hypothetical protein [Archangium lansinium]